MVDSPFISPAHERRSAPRPQFRKRRRRRERVHMLGQLVDLVKPEEVLHHVQTAVAEGRKTIVANHNLHSLYLIQKNPEMRAFYAQAEMVEVDSTPMIWFSRTLGLHSRGFHRCTYLDWRDHFWSVANRKKWRIAYVGGEPGVSETAAERLNAVYPHARILPRHGFFDASAGSADNAALIADLIAFKPEILFVGMGMPRQEAWILRNLELLPNCVIFSVGAAFDYEAGTQKPAPRWMGRAGVEWAYRLVQDPKRLFRRYCVEPWTLIPLAISDIRAARRRKAGLAPKAAREFGAPPVTGYHR
ncbi:WecB/TagA/CpsF family glycosyltransferase [Brevundimonas nasdae]|uniref:WecB/TagA/CpsF family glycosyltransferase n=2 Tax=Brevundimonas nasdae TaxID=172043 RepID=A0ABX8TFS0_9CAUL|nr:WecB/TagA/CpsF family glycosyltransferase [Brevundimonas nasdae]QYC15329.1 WecB/TagA/CpsF family glycosyltransferase [Brevundimonas nasdae]